jgi:N-methylhydantoinase B
LAVSKNFDAVDLSVMWDRLISITDEGAAALVRTSFSTLVREGFDLTVLIFDVQGRMIAQSAKCIPVFIGTASVTLSHMLAKYPKDTLAGGDVVISNDPVFGTGHMFDIAVMRPIIHQGTLIGYVMSITHLPDIGGMGFSVSATEIYHEGLRLPILKLVRGGVMDHDIVELIRLNVRVPEQVLGDIFANVSCTETVVREVKAFIADYHLSDIATLADAIIGQSETAVRRALSALPDGNYSSETDVEALDDVRRLCCQVSKQSDRLTISFEGTGPTVRAGINVPFPYTRAMALYAIKCLTTPEIPNNDGAITCISITAPEGSILNAKPPVASAGRHTIGHFIVPLIMEALAPIMPEQVCAASGLMDILTFQGQQPDGREMSTTLSLAGGFGAMRGLDGRQTMPGSSNMGYMPVEIFEPRTGILVESKQLRIDSGGAGKFRGGPGQITVLRNTTGHDLQVFQMGNRTRFAAKGLFGGEDGMLRVHAIDGKEVSAQASHVLPPNARLRLEQAGGGGYGPPAERRPEDVDADISSGFLSKQKAAMTYAKN